MNTYNRALDYVCLALHALAIDNKPVLAARLLADAAKQGDVKAAIKTLERSNAHAAKVMEAAVKAKKVAASAGNAKSRLKASEGGEEFPFEGGGEEEAVEEAPIIEGEFEGDPLDEVDDAPVMEEDEDVIPEAAPAVAMASVLTSMQRQTTAKAKPAAKK